MIARTAPVAGTKGQAGAAQAEVPTERGHAVHGIRRQAAE